MPRATTQYTHVLNALTKGTEHRLNVRLSYEEAFGKVKVSACKWILTAPFDPRRLTIPQTDSSGFACGGLLMQFDPVRGCNRVVLVFSERWDDAAKSIRHTHWRQ